MNIVLTIMAGGCHPVQVVIKRQGEGFHAKTLGTPNPVEAWGKTFNGAIDAISKRAAYSADVAA